MPLYFGCLAISLHRAVLLPLTQVFSEFYDGQQGRHGFLIVSKLLHPRSEGTLRLRSRDAFDHPLIDPRYLQREEDVDVILEGDVI